MINRTFLVPPEEDGTRVRAKILKRFRLNRRELADNPELVKFKGRVNDKYDEIVTYNDIVDFIEQDQTWDGIWKYREILTHQGPLKRSHPNYRGSSYNLQVKWEIGEITWDNKSAIQTFVTVVCISARRTRGRTLVALCTQRKCRTLFAALCNYRHRRV